MRKRPLYSFLLPRPAATPPTTPSRTNPSNPRDRRRQRLLLKSSRRLCLFHLLHRQRCCDHHLRRGMVQIYFSRVRGFKGGRDGFDSNLLGDFVCFIYSIGAPSSTVLRSSSAWRYGPDLLFLVFVEGDSKVDVMVLTQIS
jgi:hypothetical protein